jgi:two-component system, chemotaxis family, CheB/CheR fusion protein
VFFLGWLFSHEVKKLGWRNNLDARAFFLQEGVEMSREKKDESEKSSTPTKETQNAGSAPLRESTGPRFPIVGMGASAGGLEAFETFFKAMPSDSGMAFVLVAHLDPTHISLLPELVQKHTQMKVFQVEDGVMVEPNAVYVIPPNKNLNLFNGRLQLMDLPHPRGANLPIDSFLRSLAQDQGSNAICIILSGTGTDGTLGLKAIKGELGMVMVQDEETARYDGMPRSAIATSLVDYILPPNKMPDELIRYVQHAGNRGTNDRLIIGGGAASGALQKVYALLRTRTHHDFSLYKENTICRRIERRMHVHQLDDISTYVRYLQESDREVDILFKELLIGVTSFFRDPPAFGKLKEILLKQLADKPNEYNFRVWVPGCSTGEEAYSVALLLQECMEELKAYFNIQIFGTDIDEEAINFARTGLYPASIAADVGGGKRLGRFFFKEEEGYQIKKMIREMLVFAPQNVIKDPPFTKLDLLCCRNLLIYLSAELQQKLLPIFHYSLKPNGVLFLGSSETIGPATDLFVTQDKKWKIFGHKPSTVTAYRTLDFPTVSAEREALEAGVSGTVQQAEELSALQLVETILQQSDAPPCIIVDVAYNVLYIHGHTGRYLEPAIGRTSVNILEMARPGLKAELTAALREVAIHKEEVVRKGLEVEQNGGHLSVDLSIRPILEQTPMRGLLMIVFEEAAASAKEAKKTSRPARKRGRKNVEEIERELQHMKEDLQTTIEELETSNEELKSTNEELQSTNEELQSTNEELETSKEELQSLNEESVTVNAELQNRVEELSHINDDIKNLLDSTQIATLFLDTELRVRRFTPKMTEIIPLTGADLDRPVTHFAANLQDVDLAGSGEAVLENLVPVEREVSSRDGNCFRMRVFPYRTTGNVIDGVVITLVDITELKQVEGALRASEERGHSILKVAGDGIYEIGISGKIVFANEIFAKMFGFTAEELIGKDWNETVSSEIMDKEKEAYGRLLAGEIIEGGGKGIHKDGREIYTWFRAGPIHKDGELAGIIGTIKDIAEGKRDEK